jgi:hypothetical protein
MGWSYGLELFELAKTVYGRQMKAKCKKMTSGYPKDTCYLSE